MTDEVIPKPFWKSKTIWVNTIFFAALVIQTQAGFIVSPEEQIAILAVVNLVLRAVTNEPLG